MPKNKLVAGGKERRGRNSAHPSITIGLIRALIISKNGFGNTEKNAKGEKSPHYCDKKCKNRRNWALRFRRCRFLSHKQERLRAAREPPLPEGIGSWIFGHGVVNCHEMGDKLCHHMVYSFLGGGDE